MIEHYDAFISYRHAKLDTEIAESIQHDLEHFRIPRAVRRSSGKKRLDRIFREPRKQIKRCALILKVLPKVYSAEKKKRRSIQNKADVK